MGREMLEFSLLSLERPAEGRSIKGSSSFTVAMRHNIVISQL